MTTVGYPPLAAAILSVLLIPRQGLGQSCDPWTARSISVQGTVEVQRAQQAGWAPVVLDDTFCPGDTVRVMAFSRAALLLPDQTVLRLDQNTSLSFVAPQDDRKSWLNVLNGWVHIISRDPRALKVITPFADAGIEGTEFLIQVAADQATVTVFEGQVAVSAGAGSATAGSGESVTARPGQISPAQRVIRPRDAVQWTLYYPPIYGGVLPAADAEPQPQEASDTRFFTGRAAQRLAVGRVEEARADLERALSLAPDNAEALALQSIIAITQNDKTKARELAERAVAQEPGSATALIALSYAQQAEFDLDGALASLQQAVDSNPDHAIAWARLAELWLATGELDRSLEAAQRAVTVNPDIALTQTVLGFAYLSRVDTAKAKEVFQKAIAFDSAAPLSRLGLGLAKIRAGDLEGGREEIEIAVILDPNNALIRSYVGKAYYEEKRDNLAESQLGIAKELDPLDPTAFYYDAIRKQTVNQPVDALKDLRKSTELNDKRAVYRSRLLLDDDAAARNANISAVYNELGFEALAVTEATEALADSFGNSSAHRLLANAYARLPRYDISRVSESFQAQIRQPLTAPPVNLLESIDNLGVLRDTGPARTGVSEYNSLFNRDQLRIQADAIVGSRDTWGDQFVASGLVNDLGFAASQLHYTTDGFLENNAAQKNVYDGFLQTDLSPDTSLQLDVRHSDFKLGYTFFAFDEANSTPVEIDEKADVVRFNGRHATSPGSDWIWTLAYESRQRDVDYLDILATRTEADTYVGEVQRLDRLGEVQIISGAGYIDMDQEFPIGQATLPVYDANAYIYGQWRAKDSPLSFIGGFAFDKFRQEYSFGLGNIEREQLSPKLGVVWSPFDGTTLRAAAFTSVRRPFIGGQTIEPTQVAGFNQFFTGLEQFYGDPEGTVSRRVAIAVDQILFKSVFAGVEGALRQLDVPSVVLHGDRSWREKSARAYLYKTFSVGGEGRALSQWNAAVSLTTEYEDLSRPKDFTGPEGILDLETIRIPVGLALFGPRGVALRVVTSYVYQEGAFSIDTLLPTFPTRDDAWVTDLFLEYRLPRRLGIVSLGARNLFDSTIDVVEPDPLSPRVAARRIVYGTINLTF